MKRVRSFAEEMKGALYLVATPIGNLMDMTERARRILTEVDLIAAEDTRVTRKLLSHFDIHTPLISYHRHSEESRLEELLQWLGEGKRIALVSDAGLPGLSDPGEELIRATIEKGIPVIPIPGANAALSALIGSGLPMKPHVFLGFLPRDRKGRREELKRWQRVEATLLFYESPHRVPDTLKDMLEILGDRRAVLARELTKVHEEWIRGTLSELASSLEGEEMKGEFTLVVEGAVGDEAREEKPWWEGIPVTKHVELWMERGLNTNEAIRKTAEERKLPKREVYNAYHRERG